MSLQPRYYGRYSNAPSLYPDPFWSWRSSLRENQNLLDLYDPFDEFDRNFGRNFHWYFKPLFSNEMVSAFPRMPRVPHHYRITLDCTGFKPSSINFSLDDTKRFLTVTAREESKEEGQEDFNLRHFRKRYQLPENALPDQMISFMADNQLIIEVPLQESDEQPFTDLLPQVVEDERGVGGQKQVTMRFNLPANIDPADVNINVKGHDVILRAERKLDRSDGASRYYYYQRTTFPEQTRMDELRCVRGSGESDISANQICVSAPLDVSQTALPYTSVPIENWQKRQSSYSQLKKQTEPQTERTERTIEA